MNDRFFPDITIACCAIYFMKMKNIQNWIANNLNLYIKNRGENKDEIKLVQFILVLVDSVYQKP